MRVTKLCMGLLAFTFASLFIFLTYNESVQRMYRECTENAERHSRKAANLELEERLLLAELGCGRYSSMVSLPSVRLDLMNNMMTTEGVSAKYRKCDDQLQGEIKSRRGGGATNIAFSIIVHRDIAILEHQFKILFRPNHAFCLHVDAKAKGTVLSAVQNMVDCYKRVWPDAMIIIPAKPISTYWGHISLVDSELKCLQLLESEFSNWTHVMNLAGSELPIHPLGIIEYTINNTLGIEHSFVWSNPMPENERRFIEFKHELNLESTIELQGHESRYVQIPREVPGMIKKDPPPLNLTIFKGFKNVILSRPKVQFLLNNPVPIEFRKWLEDTMIPDEHFYATLIRVQFNKETGKVVQDLRPNLTRTDICPRYSLWEGGHAHGCHGHYKRDICNLGLLDLAMLMSGEPSTCLMVNKFDLDVDPLAASCWTQHILREEKLIKYV